MAQVFPRSANALARVTAVSAVIAPLALFGVLFFFERSPYVTQAGVPVEQPIPFSHKHHVGDDGIACEYCHTTVERPFAGMPSSETCMNCHSQIWNQSQHPGARSAERRAASRRLGACPQLPGLRLLRPQHPYPEGRGLRNLPRTGG